MNQIKKPSIVSNVKSSVKSNTMNNFELLYQKRAQSSSQFSNSILFSLEWVQQYSCPKCFWPNRPSSFIPRSSPQSLSLIKWPKLLLFYITSFFRVLCCLQHLCSKFEKKTPDSYQRHVHTQRNVLNVDGLRFRSLISVLG